LRNKDDVTDPSVGDVRNNIDTNTMEIFTGSGWVSIQPSSIAGPTPVTKKYIIAGNYAQYRAWLFQKGYSPSEYVYVSTTDTLRGVSNPHGFFVGTYEDRPDINGIKLQIKLAQR
jgi:hypothetical protein